MKENWIEFYREQAKEAAETTSGAYLLIGILTEMLSAENLPDCEKVEHAKFLLAEYHKARGMGGEQIEMGN